MKRNRKCARTLQRETERESEFETKLVNTSKTVLITHSDTRVFVFYEPNANIYNIRLGWKIIENTSASHIEPSQSIHYCFNMHEINNF